MRIFVYTLIIIATLALGSVASAEDPPHVITGQVVQREEHGIIVQSAKKRLDITTGYDVKYTGARPKVGDTVTVHCNPAVPHLRFGPDCEATKIEVKAAGGSNR